MNLNWVEISRGAIKNNIGLFRKLVGPKVILGVSVKANAYGHGLVEFSKTALAAGADWLDVNALFEVEKLRKAGVKTPIYIMGYVPVGDLADVVHLNARLVVYNKQTIKPLAVAARRLKKRALVHIKVETGNYRQGVPAEEVVDFVRYVQRFPEIKIEGIATHFANIEDIGASDITRAIQNSGAKHFSLGNYPALQFENFKKIIADVETAGVKAPLKHCANSASTLLFPETHMDMVRTGIAAYGLWPSEEVKIALRSIHKRALLQPVLSWKTRIAQVKEVPKGSYVGYGGDFRTTRRTRLAILPVGYYDGFDRGFSNKGHVLIHGKRAPLRGRVCMNISMVDITNIPSARIEDEVTLLGRDGRHEITAEYLAGLIDTINYEIPTRIREGTPRVLAE